MNSTNKKKNIPMPDMKVLHMHSGGKCAICKATIFLFKSDGNVSNLGEMAHIKGERPEAARYDASMSDDERQSYHNLILACGKCHKEIDDDEQKYTVELLHKIKKEHEESIKNDFITSINSFDFAELTLILKYLSSGNVKRSPGSGYTLLKTEDKINKNDLSESTAGFITMGLANFDTIRDYINKQSSIDFSFEENLRSSFINKYNELKESITDSEKIFAEMWDFATLNNNEDKKISAAGLSVVTYFFHECDIFEK